MLENLKSKIVNVRAHMVIRDSSYRPQLEDLPDELFTYWKNTAHKEFPGIPSDAIFFARAAEGLLMFFDIVRNSERACGLPSKAADSVWHAWSAMSQAQLDRYCCKHFARAIPHLEAGQMAITMDLALATSLVAARKLDGLVLASCTVPRLFGLDRRLKMPGGFAYRVSGGELGFSQINQRGIAEAKMQFPFWFNNAELLAAGLITQSAYDAQLLKKKARQDGAACGSGFSNSSCDLGSAADSCDAGGGGSSCGSSCGGGCGSS
jgi:hypothetical protein